MMQSETATDGCYRSIRQVGPVYVADLYALYQDWWWTQGRTHEQAQAVLQGPSLAFGVLHTQTETLVGFARVLTDGVLKAMIYDVIVHRAHQGQGLGRLLMEAILVDPVLQRVQHLDLYCEAAMRPFYQKWGFGEPAPRPLFLMRRHGTGARQS